MKTARPIRIAPRRSAGFQKFTATPTAGRSFNSAMVSRLTADWMAGDTSADAELWAQLRILRNRARELERNNPYMERHLGQCEVNVVGHSGVRLQCRAKNPDGSPDKLANQRVEDGWREWSKAKTCTVTRSMTMRELETLIVRSVRRDGEVFIRIIRGFGNDWQFALQPLEADFVDYLYNVPRTTGGNEIKMGVELDVWGAPVAYWTFERHPGDYYAGAGAYEVGRRQRIPASEMIHVYIRQRVGQTRGYPPAATVMLLLKMLGGYEEAELVAARAEACKLPVITTPHMEGGPLGGDAEDENGNPIDDFAPGMTVELPYGKEIHPYNPTHPNGNYPDYRKGVLRGVAAGLNTGYNTLAMDLEGVNFSSLRTGLLDEREFWKCLQTVLIERFETPVFEAWLEMALLTGMVNLPPSKLVKFNNPDFKGRRWDWVDPLKDVMAAKEAVALRVKSRTEIIEEKGGDVEDVFADLGNEEILAEAYGIELPDPANPNGMATEAPEAEPEKEEDTTEPDPEDEQQNDPQD